MLASSEGLTDRDSPQRHRGGAELEHSTTDALLEDSYVRVDKESDMPAAESKVS
jgi:hypothetical protein